jgi:lipoprotein-releasing system ATP-binding protein
MENRSDILTATDIRRDFVTPDGVLAVLKSLNLNVNRGEMVSVSGVSGVGKSTLLHILGGLDRPTSGEVVISGQSFSGMSHEALAHFRNKKVGFVFQFHYLLEDFSALENVMLPRMIAGKSKGQTVRKAELLLEQVGLKDRMNHLPTQLSGGEQQRVAVARALVNDPEIVLADEPSGNLDTATGARLHELLLRLNAESAISFLIATHNRELAGNCHRQLEIVDGKIRQYVS